MNESTAIILAPHPALPMLTKMEAAAPRTFALLEKSAGADLIETPDGLRARIRRGKTRPPPA